MIFCVCWSWSSFVSYQPASGISLPFPAVRQREGCGASVAPGDSGDSDDKAGAVLRPRASVCRDTARVRHNPRGTKTKKAS